MPTPPYIRKLRERIGSDYLWLSGATAVVYREQDSKVLLVRRSDNGAWTPITGIVDPGESPALTCLREAQEEANVQIKIRTRLRLAHWELDENHRNLTDEVVPSMVKPRTSHEVQAGEIRSCPASW